MIASMRPSMKATTAGVVLSFSNVMVFGSSALASSSCCTSTRTPLPSVPVLMRQPRNCARLVSVGAFNSRCAASSR